MRQKQLLTGILSAAMMLPAISAVAADNWNVKGVYYFLNEKEMHHITQDGIIIKNYIGAPALYINANARRAQWGNYEGFSRGPLYLSETVNINGVDYTLTDVTPRAFKTNYITALSIPGTVEHLYANTLSSTLESVSLGEGLKFTDSGALANGKSITSISIPASMRTICANSFAAMGLTEVSIAPGVTRIGTGCFSDNAALRQISLPYTLRDLDGAFRNCTALKRVDIYGSPRISNSFNRCNFISEIYFHDEVAEDFSISSSFVHVDPSKLTVYVPEGSTETFRTYFPSANIVETTTDAPSPQRKEFSFGGLQYLVTDADANKVMLVSPHTDAYSHTGEVVIPNTFSLDGVTYTVAEMDASLFNDTQATSLTLPDGITYLTASIKGANLTTLSLGEGIRYFGIGCVSDCPRLESLVIPKSVRLIGRDCFNNLGVSSLTIEEGVNWIDRNSFGQLPNLKEVSLPASLKYGHYIFNGCEALERVVINNVDDLTSSFNNCPNIREIVINTPNFGTGYGNCFQNIDPTKVTVYVPYGGRKEYEGRFKGCTIIEMPENNASSPQISSDAIHSRYHLDGTPCPEGETLNRPTKRSAAGIEIVL